MGGLAEDYAGCLKYVDEYWDKIICRVPKDRGVRIGLPNKFISPNSALFKEDQFYWDSYFIILGLIESGRVSLAKGMVDNLVFLYKKYGIIPSRNRLYNLGISQPPFLSSMAREVYKVTRDRRWLNSVARVCESELTGYWMGEFHLIRDGLSRYCDHFVTHATAEHESGWDMTSRFQSRCLNVLPVDLNSCLFKYEKDLAEMHALSGDRSREKFFLRRASKRKKAMVNLMWDERLGFFFDYDYGKERRGRFQSVAGFYPLWAGLADESQAERVKRNLKLFEQKGGLANTQETGLSDEFRQHDYPNGWANQHWIAVKGLMNYGFVEDARRISLKWLKLNKRVFEETGEFWEKYDVVSCGVGRQGRYTNQSGFGWTNAVFIKLIKQLSVIGSI